MMDITNWNDVRPHIHDRLLSAALCYRYPGLVQENAAGDVWRSWYVDLGSRVVPVNAFLLEKWGVTIEDLVTAADENADPTVMTMPGALGFDDACHIPMFVITNRRGVFGASSILRRGVQEQLSDVFRDGYLVLPSSIHEVIAVDADIDAQAAAQMVRDINASIVSDDDKLSDHVFTIRNGRLSVAA